MTEPGWMNGPPATILVATDLSARCDRALDRAVQLAEQWNARILAVHAVETEDYPDLSRIWEMPSWRRPPDPEQRARDQLLAELAELAELSVAIDVHVEAGKPVDVILAAAARENAGLIVTGVARDEPLNRSLLGDTVHRLMRNSPVPLLITRNKARAPYRRVVVATDFAASSRHALEAATRFFPDADFTLFNGYDVPFASYLTKEEVQVGFRNMEEEVASRFLAEADIAEEVRRRIGRLIEHGAPEALLRDYVRGHRVDLTVVGSHGGGAIYELVIGSTARRIIDTVPGDVLLVRDPGA